MIAPDALWSRQQQLHAETDRGLDAAFAEAERRAGRPYACRAGCSACCRQLVLCTAPEALLIAHRLRTTLDRNALAAMQARLEAQSAAAVGLDVMGYARARISCAFLDAQGACTVYPVRPMGCRALKSFSAAACGRPPESAADLGIHAIPGSGPGFRVARHIGERHCQVLATEAAVEPADFSLRLPRAVAIALAADGDALPDFAPARVAADDLG
jgi:hypothetical protein